MAKSDLTNLEPVMAIKLSQEGTHRVIEINTGTKGTGTTCREALQSLKIHTSGEVFLETARFVIVAKEDGEVLDEMMDVLRPGCEIVFSEANVTLQEATEYLQFHRPKLTVREYRVTRKSPKLLRKANGGMELV